MNDTAIQLSSVTREFTSSVETVVAVRDASLDVLPGSLVCLFGASGSGKSTLLNLMAGLDRPTAGRVTVMGRNVGEMSEDGRTELRLRTVGMVFQEHLLIEEFTVLQNVMLPLEVQGIARDLARKAALLQLETVGVGGLVDRFPSQVSGGQRQRVGVARALVGQRPILLADEPTGSLDSSTSDDLFGLFSTLAAQGCTVVVASHDVRMQRYADVVFELVDGRPLEVSRTT